MEEKLWNSIVDDHGDTTWEYSYPIELPNTIKIKISPKNKNCVVQTETYANDEETAKLIRNTY